MSLGREVGRSKAFLSCLVPLLAVAFSQPAAADSPPLPCSAAPQAAAVSFFEFIEAPGGEDRLVQTSARILSATLRQTTPPGDIARTIKSIKAQYGLDRKEVPLSRRLDGYPKVLAPGQPGFNPRAQQSVRILALSSRGKVEQRVALTCEDSVWKIVSFAYGPP